MALDEGTLKAFVESFRVSRKWNTEPRRTVNDEIFFIRRRAAYHGAGHPAWEQEPGQPKIKTRIEPELNAVAAYIDGKLKTSTAPGPLGGSSGGPAPAHLDLADLARRKVLDKATDAPVKNRVEDAVSRRRERVGTIVRRAAGLHDVLWNTAAPIAAPALITDAMDEILDRRLRSVERMNFNVASHAALAKDDWKFVTATSGWTDGFRVRMFEYARIPAMRELIALIGAANIEEPEVPKFTTPKPWKFSQGRQRVEYNVSPAPPRTQLPSVHLPTSIASNWDFNQMRGHRIELVPSAGKKGSAVIDTMFTPSPDWWDRTWLRCDHVASALHIEALLLGLRRRQGASAGEATFDGLVDGTGAMPSGAKQRYVGLDYLLDEIGEFNVGYLMEHVNDPFFENTAAEIDDLEIGDHVIFYNSFVYRRISTGDWRIENAFVVDVESKDDGRLPLDGLHLQGHGTGEKSYSGYTEEIAGHLREAIGNALTKIIDAVKAKPNVTEIEMGETSLIRWSPYESFGNASLPVRTIGGVEKVVLPEKGAKAESKTFALGAWWIEIDFADWGTATGAVMAIPKAVGVDASGIVVSGAPTTQNPAPAMQTIATAATFKAPANAASSVFFPLLEPRLNSAAGVSQWASYLTKRKNKPAVVPPLLDPVAVDGVLMPGLFPMGRSSPRINLVRPSVRP
jgi:hypothetical protein